MQAGLWGLGDTMLSTIASEAEGWSAPQPIDIDTALSFEHAVLSRGYALWQRMANGRPMPDRTDIDPRAHGKDLRCLSLFDIHWADGGISHVTPRLLGADFEDVLGSIGSEALADNMTPAARERWRLAADAMVEHGGPVRATGHMVQESRRHISFELLVAPLSDSQVPYRCVYVISAFSIHD